MMSFSMLTALFMELTAGLLYPSESDRPISVHTFANQTVNETFLRDTFSITADKPMIEQDLSGFFGNWADPQPWHDDGYQQLQKRMAALRAALSGKPGVKVFRFQGIESDWIIMVPENRGFTVLHTQSVET